MVRDALEQVHDFILRKPSAPQEHALVLSGGGARSAYQAGVLRYIAEAIPEARFSILAGVSAGAINAAHMAVHAENFTEATAHLVESWRATQAEHVFEAESSFELIRRLFVRTNRLAESPEALASGQLRRALVDTSPLRAFLERQLEAVGGHLTRATANVRSGRVKAFAITGTNYTTGQTVTWVQGRNIKDWERPDRLGVRTTITLDHIMASTSLPLLFPAVRIGDHWYGDGSIRLMAPLAPAVHLGADRILVISTRYGASRLEADARQFEGYPPAAQILGLMMNAVFLDVLDQDALMLERVNRLVEALPRRKRLGLRPIRLLLLRPSVDLGKLAGQFELQLDGALGLLTRGLGTSETANPDWLSMLLFETEYIERIIDLGYRDARRQHARIAAFFSGAPDPEPSPGTMLP